MSVACWKRPCSGTLGGSRKHGSTRSSSSGGRADSAKLSSRLATRCEAPTRPSRANSNECAPRPSSSGADRIRSSIGKSGRRRRGGSRRGGSLQSRNAAISPWWRSRPRPRRPFPHSSARESSGTASDRADRLFGPLPRLEVVSDPDALDLRVFAHRLEAELAAHAAHLGTAERRGRVDELVGIDPDHARLELRRDPMRAPQIAGPETRAESVRYAVRHVDRGLIVGEGRNRDEGPEDLLLADAHLRIVRADERRLHVVPASRLRRARDAAAEQDLRPLALRHVHVAEDLLLVILRRERAKLRRLLERIPDPNGSHPLREALDEGIPNRFVDKEARAGDAGLTLVVVGREKGSLDGGVEVRILEDHVGPLASEF